MLVALKKPCGIFLWLTASPANFARLVSAFSGALYGAASNSSGPEEKFLPGQPCPQEQASQQGGGNCEHYACRHGVFVVIIHNSALFFLKFGRLFPA